MKYAWISEHRNDYPVALMCRVLEVSASAYYDRLNRKPSTQQQRREKIARAASKCYFQSHQIYGYRKVWQDLLEAGGLTITRTVKYERVWPRSLADVRWYLKHPKDLIRLLLGPFVPLNWANYFVYLGGKATDVR